LFVSDVDVSARVDQDVFGLVHKFRWQRADAFEGRRRDEPAGFFRQPRVLDVENPQPGVEIGQVDQIGLLLHIREVVLEIRIVRAEPSPLVTEVGVGFAGGRHGSGKDRNELWLRQIFDIDHGDQIHWAAAGGRLIGDIAAAAFGVREEQRPAGNIVHVVNRDAGFERRHEIKPANLLGMGDVADVQSDHGWPVAEISLIAIDDCGAVKRCRRRRRRLAVLLPRQPEAAGFLRIFRIADIQKDKNLAAVARHVGRETGVLAARVADPVNAGAASLPLRELLRIHRIADIPEQHALVVRLVRVATPDRRLLLQRREHQVVVHFHLDGPGIGRAGHKLDDFGVLRVGDVDNGPAVAPEVAEVQVPAGADVANSDLERATMAVEIAVADGLNVTRLPAGGNLIGARTLGREKA